MTATGILLALPFATLFAMLVLHIEPPLRALEALRTDGDGPNVIGSAIVLGAWLLSIVGLVFGIRGARAHSVMTASPLTLIVAGAIALLVISFPAALVIDQYPCWTGVPNCD